MAGMAAWRIRWTVAVVVGVLIAALGLGGTAAAAPSAPTVAAASGTAPLVGHWTFDEGSGTTAADSVTPGHPLTLEGGAGWGPGLIGPSALSPAGGGQYAQASGPVLDTSQSFSVSAWVNLRNTDGYQTFVSQDGTNISGFFLQLRADTHQFAFTLPSYDAIQSYAAIATDADVIPQPDEWYQLVGVYDASAQTASLYVNGTLAQTISRVPQWSADGAFAVGRSLYAGSTTDWVNGEIDDVRAYQGALTSAQVAALAGPGRLTVDGRDLGPATNPTQFGEFLEEINHSGDGGLYAELIRNRDLKESASSPVAWSGLGGTVALSHADPLTSATPVSLRLSVPVGAGPGRAGVVNAGWWGFPVKPATTYRVSFYARAAGPGLHAPLSVDLESASGHVWAVAKVGTPSAGWQRYTAMLHTPKGIASSLTNRFVISAPAAAAAGARDWFTLVSVFPPTYDGAPNGFRIDLMKKLAALHPGYLRVPGGNYLEGATVATRFDWRTTIGPLEDRPGHENTAWGYWSQDGMGLLEYLELAEQLHAQPVLAVWAGYTLDGSVVPEDQLAPYVRQAVHELQYAIGPTSTYWGHQRALDGHPAPFPVHMVEIGNEDFFDTSGSYGAYRYPMFYDAIHRAFGQLQFIATTPVTSRPYDVVDDHYYSEDPATFAQDAHLFDGMSASGPKVIVGEYATTNATPTGTLADAVGESAFLTGTVRDADVVLGASYAPLLVNVNAPSWPTNLIGYDGLSSYGSPSYYAQKMLADNLGARVVGSQIVAGSGTLFDVATESPGHLCLTVVNDGARPAQVQIALQGFGTGASAGTETVLTGPPDAQNTLAEPHAVVPHSHPLGALGDSFTGRLEANSVTVLDLVTSQTTGGRGG